MSDNAEVLHLQSTLNAHDAMQTDLARHKAKEATWSVLRAELTRHFEEAHARAMAELSVLRECHIAIEVICAGPGAP
jgi:hypothetical protein